MADIIPWSMFEAPQVIFFISMFDVFTQSIFLMHSIFKVGVKFEYLLLYQNNSNISRGGGASNIERVNTSNIPKYIRLLENLCCVTILEMEKL